MLRILLKRKYLYEVLTQDNVWEKHYRYTYMYIGYKGQGISGQTYFITIVLEDYIKIFAGASLEWHSPF